MSKVKKIVAGVVVIALVGTAAGGGLMYVRKGNQKEVLVASVSSLVSDYYGTDTSLSGNVYANATQRINVDKDMMNSEIGFCRKVLQAFEESGISIEHMPSGIDTMTVFVHQEEFEGKEQEVLSTIHKLAEPDVIDLEPGLALIAVVGRGMRSTRGTAGRIFSALAHVNVNVKMIDQGSSELNIIIGVKNSDFETALKAIYDIFVVTQL